MTKKFTGECPYINDTHFIHIDYKYVPMTRTLTSNYKRTEFDCSFSSECPYVRECPIYQNAPRTSTE